MKKNYFYYFALLCLANLAFVTEAGAQIIIGHDEASTYTTESWNEWNSQGGTGFTPWIMFTLGMDNPNGEAGHLISSSVENGFGDVDTNSKAFSMYGYRINNTLGGNPESVIYRYFNNTGAPVVPDTGGRTPLMAGQGFSIDLAVAFRNGYKGIDLRNSQGDNILFNFGMDGDRRYEVNQDSIFGNVYMQHSVFKIKAYQVTDTTFKVNITRGEEVWQSGIYNGTIGGFKLYESSTSSSNVLNRLYFNNLTITNCAEVTTWDGTAWSNGNPSINKTVIIAGDYTSTASISACMVVVQDGADVLFEEGHTLTVANTIEVKNGATLTFENNAALVQIDENAANIGNITVKRNSNALYKLDYTLWGAPVAGQELQAFSTGTLSNRFYTYAYNWSTTVNPIIYREQYWATDASQNFVPGKAYLIRMPNEVDGNAGYNGGTAAYSFPGSFTGVPNNGTVNIPIIVANLNNDDEADTFLSQAGHYIAVSNPYASPISISEFFSQNAAVLEPGNGIYFWRKKNDSEASSYSCLTMAAFTENEAVGGDLNSEYYTTPDDDVYNQNWIISPGQGFLVKLKEDLAGTATVTFTNSMRKPAGTAGPFFRTANNNAPLRSKLWLNLSNTNNAFSQAAIVYTPEATLGLDYSLDGKSMSGGNAKLYSITAGANLSVQARPAFEASDVVPMGFTVSAAGQYTITLDHVNGIFSSSQNIYLKDNLNGTMANLSENPYIFATDAGTFDTRFEVIYTPVSLSNPTHNLTDAVVVYKQNGAINIATGTTEMTDVAVYDMQGRVLYTKGSINATEATVNNLNIAQQIIIVEINTLSGKVSRKILY